MPIIRILKPSLDDVVVEGNPCLRGVIDPASFKHLRIDAAYQREFLSPSTRRWLTRALNNGQRLPDIELGMRGGTWSFDESSPEFEIVALHDPTFIIDGQQRRGTIMEHMKLVPGFDARLGAIVHFNSTMEWERERFHALNLHQTRVSSAILLRNLRSTTPGIATAYGLSVTDPAFPLQDRVCWQQAMAVKDLLSASIYIHAVLVMHGHLGGGIVASGAANMGPAMDKLVAIIGLPTLRANIKTYWDLYERCWGLRDLAVRGSTWTRVNFINALSDVFSDHLDFWQGKEGHTFHVPAEIRDKLAKFPVNDPEIRNLAASSGQAKSALTFHLTSWIDKGRRITMVKRNIDELLTKHRAAAMRDVQRLRRGRAQANIH